MRRVTLDANVLASGFASPSGAAGRLLDAWRADVFQLVISEHLLHEVALTLTNPYFITHLVPGDAAAFVSRVSTFATVTGLTVPVRGVATHPEDDLVLSTALSGNASILCTRDKQLLRLRSYTSVAILSPGELLAFLVSEGLV